MLQVKQVNLVNVAFSVPSLAELSECKLLGLRQSRQQAAPSD